MRVGELLRPISGAMAQELLAGNYIQADETPSFAPATGAQSARATKTALASSNDPYGLKRLE